MNATAAVRAARAATPPALTAARDFARDTVSNHEAVDDAPIEDVVLYVDRKYAGGWAAFVAEIGVAA